MTSILSRLLPLSQHASTQQRQLKTVVNIGADAAAAQGRAEMEVQLADVTEDDEYVLLRIRGIKPRITANQRGWTDMNYMRIWRVSGTTKIRGLQSFLKEQRLVRSLQCP